MIYTYDDAFLVNSITEEKLQEIENDSIAEAEKMNIDDEFYKEKIIVYGVYIQIALKNLEAAGMREKLDAYTKKRNEYISIANGGSSLPKSVVTKRVYRR